MKSEASEYFDILLSLCQTDDIPFQLRYKQLRDLLERICRDQMQDGSLQITDLSARINYVASKASLSVGEQNRLHTFRLTSNAILNHQSEAEKDKLFRDIKTISFFVRKIYSEDIPAALYKLLPQADATYIVSKPGVKVIDRMRVSFSFADEEYLYVIPLDTIADEPLRVRFNVAQVNEEFKDTCDLLWEYAQLNLLDVSEDEQGILTPSFIVLEPDYLLDISSLAECYKDYGNHPANYQLNKLRIPENTASILLGNIANLFLDEWINAEGEVDYAECMQKVFRRYPLELAACSELQDPKKEREFFSSCRHHFDHIRETVTHTFSQPGYKLDKEDAVLEPSYICEPLGLQGRLDYMQRDASAIIEMKSGKADEYAIRGKVSPKENHIVQMLLYQAVLQYSLGRKHQDISAYLFYTRYPLLYPARSSWAMVRRAINLRNRIVADEYNIQLHNSVDFTRDKLSEINVSTLNERGLRGNFWQQYLSPSITRVQEQIYNLTDTERNYFYALFNFIACEQYTAKSGDAEYEGRTGAASLWLSTFTEKIASGEILYDLKLIENHAGDSHKAYVILSRELMQNPSDELPLSLPNFREGDAVILYQRNTAQDNATNRMVIKGNIEVLTDSQVRIRMRASQRNVGILPAESLYAIEHDSMDTSFRSMYAGLEAFLSCNPKRRQLLLGQREPVFDSAYDNNIEQSVDDFQRIALKALAAQDYFLLIGPPGTGKTSRALKLMVETFYDKPNTQILLLAYTNRAVDEICKSLTSINPRIDFIRLGSELPCDFQYRPYLLENMLATCNRRSDVKEKITKCRVFVGTVATLCNKPELFKLKTFDVAIIDEATQILEPQLLGLLSACDENGRDSIGKFILIGDHKQLPAVVLQQANQTEIQNKSLRAAGITNLRDSLFERLYRTLNTFSGTDIPTRAVDMLSRQGRMHPAVASFSNNAFYGGRLEPVGLPHQVDKEEFPIHVNHAIQLTNRMVYIPSVPNHLNGSSKTNASEAAMVAELAANIYNLCPETFNIHTTLGIITPYRSQIALIKKEVAKLDIPCLNNVLVDTVERYQGSERDFIIYSFCANYIYQLRFLANIIEEDGKRIDRKLNVALTRARKMMYILGVKEVLGTHSLYSNLLNFRGNAHF